MCGHLVHSMCRFYLLLVGERLPGCGRGIGGGNWKASETTVKRALCSVPVADGVEEKRTGLWVAVLWKLVGGWSHSQNFPKCQFPECKLPQCQLSNFFRVSSIA